MRRGLRGVGIWALGYQGERPELWAALRFSLDRSPDVLPPTGMAAIAAESLVGEHGGSPLVASSVRLELSARDDPGGSGLAFVRIAARGRLTEGGLLRTGTTFPAVEAVTVSMPDAGPSAEVFIPGGAAIPPSPERPTPPPTPLSDTRPATEPALTTLHVQWRDIAGNWSEPTRLRVYYDATR